MWVLRIVLFFIKFGSMETKHKRIRTQKINDRFYFSLFQEYKWSNDHFTNDRRSKRRRRIKKTHKCCISWRKKENKLSPQNWRICHLFGAKKIIIALYHLHSLRETRRNRRKQRIVRCITYDWNFLFTI